MLDRRRIAAAAAILTVFCACSTTPSRPALPPGPPVVNVMLREYGFEYNTSIPSGRVVFRLVNAGHLQHRPDLIPLIDELPPIDQQVKGEARAVVTPFAGVAPRDAGEVGTFAVDLAPGQRYAFVCFARDPDDNQSHALQGMTSEFRTPAAQTAPEIIPPTGSPGPLTPDEGPG